MDVNQIRTGIEGLDSLLQGGFLEGSSVVLVGPVGTLKSHLGFQFLYEGLRNGERCFCLSTNRDLETLRLQLRLNFGWDLKPYVDRRMLSFLYYAPDAIQFLLPTGSITELTSTEAVRELYYRIEDDVTRMLIHTISQMFTIIGNERLVLSLVYRLRTKAKKNRGVVLYILDKDIQSRSTEENVKSICDYVIETREREGTVELRVAKSLTRHTLDWHKLYMTDEGLKLELKKTNPPS